MFVHFFFVKLHSPAEKILPVLLSTSLGNLVDITGESSRVTSHKFSSDLGIRHSQRTTKYLRICPWCCVNVLKIVSV